MQESPMEYPESLVLMDPETVSLRSPAARPEMKRPQCARRDSHYLFTGVLGAVDFGLHLIFGVWYRFYLFARR